MTERMYVAAGEFRPDLLQLFKTRRADIDILLALPGLLGGEFHGQTALQRDPQCRPDAETTNSWLRLQLEWLTTVIDRLPQTEDWRSTLRAWVEVLDGSSFTSGAPCSLAWYRKARPWSTRRPSPLANSHGSSTSFSQTKSIGARVAGSWA